MMSWKQAPQADPLVSIWQFALNRIRRDARPQEPCLFHLPHRISVRQVGAEVAPVAAVLIRHPMLNITW